METKTTKQITAENYDKLDAWFTFTEDSEMQIEAEEKWVSVHKIIRWIDNLRKSNDMWRYPVDECFGMLEDAITSDSEPDGSTHNKDLTATQQVASPKSASQTSLNPDVKRKKKRLNIYSITIVFKKV